MAEQMEYAGAEGGEGVVRIGKRVFVGNLAWKTSWQDLKDKFRECGNVVYANVMRDEEGEELFALPCEFDLAAIWRFLGRHILTWPYHDLARIRMQDAPRAGASSNMRARRRCARVGSSGSWC